MGMLVHGVSLHYYNENANSDKFYRAFIWESSGLWHVAYHWGRDGAPRGQSKTEVFRTKTAVQMLLDKKVNEKISKGYQYLGQGDVKVPDVSSLNDVSATGFRLHEQIGREPVKLRNGFTLIIKEEDDIMDLIK